MKAQKKKVLNVAGQQPQELEFCPSFHEGVLFLWSPSSLFSLFYFFFSAHPFLGSNPPFSELLGRCSHSPIEGLTVGIIRFLGGRDTLVDNKLWLFSCGMSLFETWVVQSLEGNGWSIGLLRSDRLFFRNNINNSLVKRRANLSKTNTTRLYSIFLLLLCAL